VESSVDTSDIEKSPTWLSGIGSFYLNAILGVGAVLVMVTLSGYSAIYFEKMLKKGEKMTIWYGCVYY